VVFGGEKDLVGVLSLQLHKGVLLLPLANLLVRVSCWLSLRKRSGRRNFERRESNVSERIVRDERIDGETIGELQDHGRKIIGWVASR